MEDYEPDLVRELVHELIDEQWFRGLNGPDRQAFVFNQLPVDYQDVGDDKASVNPWSPGGHEGDFDRVDDLHIEVYAPGTDAVKILEKIRKILVNDGESHDLQCGYVDEIRCTTTPSDIPFQGSVNKARAIFHVRHRPW